MILFKSGKYFTLITSLSIITLIIMPPAIAQLRPEPLPPVRPEQPKLKPLPPGGTLPDDYSNFTGNVESYLLNLEGLADGLLLDNGIQVKFPPHLSDLLVEIAQIGSQVSIQGIPGVPTNFGQEVKAYSIINIETEEKVIEQPPLQGKSPSGYREYNSLTATGNVEQWLVGRRGEIKGMILSSGTQVKFPPHVGERLAFMAQDNAEIEVEGFGVENDYGRVIEASLLIIDGEPINLVSKFGQRKTFKKTFLE